MVLLPLNTFYDKYYGLWDLTQCGENRLFYEEYAAYFILNMWTMHAFKTLVPNYRTTQFKMH
jgi:hypothetical protein